MRLTHSAFLLCNEFAVSSNGLLKKNDGNWFTRRRNQLGCN